MAFKIFKKKLEGLAQNLIQQASDTYDEASRGASKFDNKYGITDKLDVAKTVAINIGQSTAEKISDVASSPSATKIMGWGKEKLFRLIMEPAKAKAIDLGLDAKIREYGHAAEVAYGITRNAFKSNTLPETSVALLTYTRTEMVHISSCIMQISDTDTESIANEFGNAVLGKIAGIATTGSLLALVSTFGTAGTGAAISGLSGAAATSASLAWVGGLLGGGMATGAVLTGGLGIVAGLAAYRALKSESRSFESLSVPEQKIVHACWIYIAIIDDHLAKKTVRFDSTDAKAFLNNTMVPLKRMLNNNKELISSNLDNKHAVLFNQHVLPDFERYVIDAFKQFLKKYGNTLENTLDKIVGIVILSLLSGSEVENDRGSQLVLSALRLSDNEIQKANQNELMTYLGKLDANQLKCSALKVKGICYQLLWIDEYNATMKDSNAEVSTKTKDKIPMILIKDKVTKRISDRFPLINPEEDASRLNTITEHTNQQSTDVDDQQVIKDILNRPLGSTSAIKIYTKKVGVSVAATAFASFLFS